MRRYDALETIGLYQEELRRRGVRSLSVFGSVARDEAGPDSDIDLLVEFSSPVGLLAFVDLQLYLERLLGCRVDLVTPDGIRESMRERIEKEAVRAA